MICWKCLEKGQNKRTGTAAERDILLAAKNEPWCWGSVSSIRGGAIAGPRWCRSAQPPANRVWPLPESLRVQGRWVWVPSLPVVELRSTTGSSSATPAAVGLFLVPSLLRKNE